MLRVLQIITASIFALAALYFGILWAIKTFEYASEVDAEAKITGAKLSTKYLCLSAIGLFLAVEIYAPNRGCIPFLLIFIGLFWLNYIAYKKTIVFLEKKNGSGRN